MPKNPMKKHDINKTQIENLAQYSKRQEKVT